MTIRIQTPCQEDWNDMTGTQQRKFCGSCNKIVHNLSEMTRQEADTVLTQGHEPCVRYRPDRNGRVTFKHTVPLLALLSTGCTYVPPPIPSDSTIVKVQKQTKRGLALVMSTAFRSIEPASSSDSVVESFFRNAATAAVELSDTVLHSARTGGAMMVMGEVEAMPPPKTPEELLNVELEVPKPEIELYEGKQ